MYCPVCKNVELRISERQGVEIDFCPQCRGVWLDRGELDKLIERSDAAYRAASHEPQKAKRGEPSFDLDMGVELPDLGSERRRDDYRRDDYGRDSYRRDEYRWDDDDDYKQRDAKKKKKSFLSEMFDIFD